MIESINGGSCYKIRRFLFTLSILLLTYLLFDSQEKFGILFNFSPPLPEALLPAEDALTMRGSCGR
jgi:hypothetical protein